MEPVRIQLKRTKGWQMPENTVKVDRTTMWGNPFSVVEHGTPGRMLNASYIAVPTAEDAVECFREMLKHEGPRADALRSALPDLRGKNLACWCKPGEPCHADVLLEIANANPAP
jgi:hypothetical protein